MQNGSGEGRDLVYLAPHGWDTITQRAQQLTTALSETRRVLYVEPAAPSLPGNFRRLARGEPTGRWRGRLIQRGPSLWSYTPTPLLPFTLQFARLNELGHHLALPRLRRALARLGFVEPILVSGWPPAVAWAGDLGESLLVYDCMDDFPAFPQSELRRRFMVAREQELAERAALITVTSEQLGEKWAPRHPRVRPLPNGVPDSFLAACLDAAPPADIAAIPGPRLLYIGVISSWLDDALLAQLACIHPEWSLVLVGPVEAASRALRQLPNVHLLGARPHEALPGYLAAADACLIPFQISPLTTAVNPVKLYEYLAAGKPVVSTALPEVAHYGEVCYVASGVQTFVRAAEQALAEQPDDPRRAERRRIAAANTWSRRAATLDELIAELLSSGTRLAASGRATAGTPFAALPRT